MYFYLHLHLSLGEVLYLLLLHLTICSWCNPFNTWNVKAVSKFLVPGLETRNRN